MATPVKGTAEQINKKGFVSAYKIDPKTGLPEGGIPSLGQPKTPTPSVSTTGVRYKAPYDVEAEKFFSTGMDVSAQDVSNIYETERKRVQGLIDAINQQYAGTIREAQQEAKGKVAESRAIGSRSGLIGSPRGMAQIEETHKANREVMKSIQAEKGLAIQEIFSKVDDRARAEVEARKEEALGKREAYLGYLKETRDEARTDFKEIAASGVTLDEMPDEQYQALLKQTGYDEFTAEAVYNTNLPDEGRTDYKYEIKGGKVFAYGVDPLTGKLKLQEKDLGIEGGITGEYTEKVMADGTLALIPDEINPDLPLEDQILLYGKSGDFKDTSGGSGFPTGTPNSYKEWALAGKPGEGATDQEKYNNWLNSDAGGKMTDSEKKQTAKSSMARALSSWAGTDTYVSPEKYKELKRNWIESENGGTAKEFDEAFADYINPDREGEYGLRY